LLLNQIITLSSIQNIEISFIDFDQLKSQIILLEIFVRNAQKLIPMQILYQLKQSFTRIFKKEF